MKGLSSEVKWGTVVLITEGGARVINDALIPRLKAEVLMKGYHFSELLN